MSVRQIRRALLSVSDKTHLVELARKLATMGVDLISTGGTRKALLDAGLAVRDISEVTGFPEMLDGRVKTLHPRVHGGILAVRSNSAHLATLEQHAIEPIDLVVCNLYPFEQTVAKVGSTPTEIIEEIDIGGPTLVRAAAKNFEFVAIATDPAQYPALIEEMQGNQGGLSLATRRKLAAAAFHRIAAYDAAISAWFATTEGETFPPVLARAWQKQGENLRYGENPHQSAAFYVDRASASPGVARARVLHGKELSYNNLLDLDAALNLVREFREPACAVIKHNNPCGTALGKTLEEAFRLAYEGDPLSAYGGVLAFNRELDEATATQITEPNRFIECIIAPAFSDAAFQLITTRPKWKASVRLLATGPLDAGTRPTLSLREVEGGLLVQAPDRRGDQEDFADLKVPTKRSPSEEELVSLRLAWVVCKHVKSNAIVLVKDRHVVGVGAGQMSRVDSTHMAVRKAGERSRGSVLASDAFFPFRDNVDEAARAGITAIVQPGGSMRDAESIAACDENNIAMVFTGYRHFRH
jgi:phosphoribosylaminoimidazolecarboxamide formyltransferase/IMP cyclohydrolase